MSVAKHEKAKSAGVTPQLRLYKFWNVRRSRLMRNLAVALGNLSDRCLRLANLSSEGKDKAARGPTVRSQLGWRSLLGQLGTQRAMAAALDAGVLGSDMARDTRLPPGRKILVLAAHQDDEAVGAGGTLLLCAKAGYEFQVIYYTDGATAFANLDPKDTVKLRHDEARRVWRRLAGVEPVFWDYPNRDPAIAADAGGKLAAAIAAFKPSAIFVPVFLEQVLEHRRMSEVLAHANAVKAIPDSIEVWGYQITTRAPGNVAVDITDVWKEKYALNRMWESQNYYIDYAHLAQGRDMANSYFLRSNKKRRTASHAETFLVFDAPTYVQLTQEFLDLPARPAIVERIQDAPPPNFFVIGLQKCGTYWLTALLDLHPQIRCFPSRPGHQDGTGEAHLFDHLARIDSDYQGFARSMRRKLDGHFANIVPKSAPANETERAALLDAVRRRFNEYCHLQRLRYGKPVVGEKTTESVHHLDLLESMYPLAQKICVLRDPRDRVVSFFFHQMRKGRLDEDQTLTAEHVDAYLDRVKKDYAGLLQASSPTHVLTYESLIADPHTTTENMLRFLGLDPDAATIKRMIDGASFERLAQRASGDEDASSHFRKGVVGDWRERLDEVQAARLTDDLEGLTQQIEARFGLNLRQYRQ